MPKYHIIVEDVQVYDFTIAIPATLTEDEREDFIWEHLSEHRDTCWRCGEEIIVAVDEVQ
jgi:hypothetical protein